MAGRRCWGGWVLLSFFFMSIQLLVLTPFHAFPPDLRSSVPIPVVYAYIPITDSLCSQTGVICNSDYGTSLGRGSFTFQRGAWNDIALHVRLNNPVDKANGVVE